MVYHHGKMYIFLQAMMCWTVWPSSVCMSWEWIWLVLMMVKPTTPCMTTSLWDNESQHYTLHIGKYSGTAGNYMHNMIRYESNINNIWVFQVLLCIPESLRISNSLHVINILNIFSYKVNALKTHNGRPFSTMDNDHDNSRSGNCAELYGGGGWWFDRCYDANLNGLYADRHYYETIVWYQLHRNHEPMKYVEMKFRPVGFGKEHY